MQDHPVRIPACFTSADKSCEDPTAVTRSGQSVFESVYQAKLADQSRLITITWCKNLMLHGLSVSISSNHEPENHHTCKVELKPWYFWRKQGSNRFTLEGNKSIDVHWDLKNAKFNGETEPISDYYVAVVFNQEVVLLLGDLKKDAYRKTGCRPALLDPILVSRKEHVFGKKRFSTRVKFHEKGRFYEITIEIKYRKNRINLNDLSEPEPELEIRVDGHSMIHVKHLQWKFRGNESIQVNKKRVEVYWDVHDWLFNPGLRHALFIFKPYLSSSSSSSSFSTSPPSPSLSSSATSPLSSQTGSSSLLAGLNSNLTSEFCLFLYAWRVE